MADKTVTMSFRDFPDDLYDRLKRRAERAQRSVEDTLVALVAAALPPDDALPAPLEQELASLASLDDEALWQAARSRLSDDELARSEALNLKRQRDGLTAAEAAAAADLARTYDRRLLVRAKAAVLLKQRGYDISSLRTPA